MQRKRNPEGEREGKEEREAPWMNSARLAAKSLDGLMMSFSLNTVEREREREREVFLTF